MATPEIDTAHPGDAARRAHAAAAPTAEAATTPAAEIDTVHPHDASRRAQATAPTPAAEIDTVHPHDAPRRAHTRELERELARLATQQYGVVARHQLEAFGFGRGAIARRVAAGRLVRLHPCVYAVGHRALRREGVWMAAVLACGPGAVLSHRSAAAVWGLRPHEGVREDVSVPRTQGRGSATIVVHRRGHLRPDEVARRSGVPCTSLALTLLDLAACVSRQALERACDQAAVMRVFDRRPLEAVLRRRGGERGAGALRSVIAEHAIGDTITLSELEKRFRALAVRAGLPPAQLNHHVRGASGDWYLVDAFWPAADLVVETDGRDVYCTPAAFERDRRRDADLAAAGVRVLRFTWRQVTREPDLVLRAIVRCLAAR